MTKIADQIADDEEQTFSDEMTFLEDLLQSLRDLNTGKINWSEMDVNDLVNKFLKHPKVCMKMVVDELNLIWHTLFRPTLESQSSMSVTMNRLT